MRRRGPLSDSSHREESLKHLRRVHSWLVLVQAGLLLAAAADTDRTLDVAIEQARAVVRVSQDWDQRWIHNRAQERFEAVRTSFGNRWPKTLDQFSSFSIRVESGPPDVIKAPLPTAMFAGAFTLNGAKGVSIPGYSDKLAQLMYNAIVSPKAPTTIQEFETIWNALNEETFINVPAVPRGPVPARLFTTVGVDAKSHAVSVIIEDVRADDKDAASQIFRAALAAPTQEGLRTIEGRFVPPIPARGPHNLRLVPPEARIDHVLIVGTGSNAPPGSMPQDKYLPYSDWGSRTRLEIPLLTYRIPFDIQIELRDMVDPTLTLGGFSEVFAELEEHVQGLKELPPEAVKNFLEVKRRRVDRNVQLLGLSFPASSLSLWGAAFLAMIQVYFFLSLRNLSHRMKSEDLRFPWIAFYEDRLARTAFVGTAFAAPPLVILFIGRSNLWPEPHLPALTSYVPVLVLAAAASAGGLFLYLRRILPRRFESARAAQEQS